MCLFFFFAYCDYFPFEKDVNKTVSPSPTNTFEVSLKLAERLWRRRHINDAYDTGNLKEIVLFDKDLFGDVF